MNLEPLLHLLAEEPETPVDVAEVNLLLAQDEYPDIDVHSHIDTLNGYAARLKRRLQGDLLDGDHRLQPPSLFGDSVVHAFT